MQIGGVTPCLGLAVLAVGSLVTAAPGPGARDREVEEFLRNAVVVASKEIGVGISGSRKLVLELAERTGAAAFKSIDVHNPGLTRFQDGTSDVNFTDSHRYERAAYLMDRLLGMGMVPVAVRREVDGVDGTAIEWIADAMNEKERRAGGHGPADPSRLSRQFDVMRVFDALIANSDRNAANQLYTPADGMLHLIDHSRSFRLTRDLPATLLDEPSSLPRSLYERLSGLDERSVGEALKGLLSHAQVRALLARRNRLIRKIDADRRRYGDEVVFHDPDDALRSLGN